MTTADHPPGELVMAWVDGEPVDAGVEPHLEGCVQCQALASEIRAVGARLAAWTVEPTSVGPRPRMTSSYWRNITMAGLVVIGLLAFSTWFGWPGSTKPVSDEQ